MLQEIRTLPALTMRILLAAVCFVTVAVTVPAAGTHVKRDRPLSISQGERVELADFLVPGHFTVFAFTSEYCPPCRSYDETLLHLHQQRANVAVVKIDINRPIFHKIDWESPVAQQYDLHALPHFTIYGPDGKLLADDVNEDRAARALVDRMINALP